MNCCYDNFTIKKQDKKFLLIFFLGLIFGGLFISYFNSIVSTSLTLTTIPSSRLTNGPINGQNHCINNWNSLNNGSSSYTHNEIIHLHSELKKITLERVLTENEIESMQNDKLALIESIKNKSISYLDETYNAKIKYENEHYFKLNKIISDYFELLKQKQVVLNEKKNAEENLKKLSTDLEIKNSGLDNVYQIQLNEINKKMTFIKNNLDEEKVLFDKHNLNMKQLIKS
jgi:hypothetical protein